MISKKDFGDQMGILAAVYQRGFWQEEAGDLALEIYYDRIGRIGRLPDLISAIKHILDSDNKFMPKPGEIIKAMRSVALSNQGKENVKQLEMNRTEKLPADVKQLISTIKVKRP